MIEKRKVLVSGKLRTIQLIEDDLQLTMRMFVNIRKKRIIELDESLGKSIEDSILEKKIGL